MKRVKDSIVAITIIIVLLVLYFGFFKTAKLKIEIAEIYVAHDSSFQRDGYAIMDSDNKYSTDYKDVCVKIKLKNNSLKPINDVWCYFENCENLPDFIVGSYIETHLPWPVNIKPFETKNVEFYFLADMNKYSEKELLEQLKNVRIYVAENGGPYNSEYVDYGNRVSKYMELMTATP